MVCTLILLLFVMNLGGTFDESGFRELARKFFLKVLEVQKSSDWVKKEGFNAFHKYAYVQEADVIQAVRPHLLTHGLVVTCSQGAPSIFQDGVALAHLVFNITDTETGFTDTAEAYGTGSDAGSKDKAVYKAITGAKKYFLTSYFLLSTGEDPEGDPAEDERASKATLPPATAKTAPPAPYAPPLAPKTTSAALAKGYSAGKATAKTAPPKQTAITPETRSLIQTTAFALKMSLDEVDAMASKQFGFKTNDLLENEAKTILSILQKQAEAQELMKK